MTKDEWQEYVDCVLAKSRRVLSGGHWHSGEEQQLERLHRLAQEEMGARKKSGYHSREIKKGVLGEASKIREEFEEFEDALAQGSQIMALTELADIYGAMEAYVESFGLTMQDIVLLSEATKRAFESGRRS